MTIMPPKSATIRASSPREKRLDATIFELAGLPVPANPAYRFRAEEIKQTAFRLDGLLQPETGRDDLPLIFVETQFYPKPDFYARWLAAIFLYLYRHPGIARPWSAIAVFPDRAADTGRLIPYEPLLQCGLVHRVYLAELPDDPSASFGTRLARLAVLDATRAVEEARALLAQQPPDHQRDLAIDLIETILVYNSPNSPETRSASCSSSPRPISRRPVSTRRCSRKD